MCHVTMDLHFKVAAVYCRWYVQVREVWGGTLSFNNIDNSEDDCEQKAKQRSDVKGCTIAPNWVVAIHGKFFGICSTNWLNAKQMVAWCKISLINITAYTLYPVFFLKIGTWNPFENVIYIDPSNQNSGFCKNGGWDRILIRNGSYSVTW